MSSKLGGFSRAVIGLLCMAPFCFYVYTDVVKNENIINDSVEIVVLNNNAEAGTVFADTSMFKTISVHADYYKSIPSLVTNVDEILNKQASTFIPLNTPIVEQSIEDVSVTLNAGEMVFSIPTDWIASSPQSIRRGDKVFIYATKSKEWDTIRDVPYKELDTSKPVLSTTVIYAKDSTNREVVTVGGNSQSEQRYDGTSTVSNLEIKLTEEGLNKLKEYHNNSYEFMVSYN